jgi:hypothetical protein
MFSIGFDFLWNVFLWGTKYMLHFPSDLAKCKNLHYTISKMAWDVAIAKLETYFGESHSNRFVFQNLFTFNCEFIFPICNILFCCPWKSIQHLKMYSKISNYTISIEKYFFRLSKLYFLFSRNVFDIHVKKKAFIK